MSLPKNPAHPLGHVRPLPGGLDACGISIESPVGKATALANEPAKKKR